MLAIRCENLGKHYRLEPRQRYQTIRECIAGCLWRPATQPGNGVWALRGIDLEIGQGEIVGLIGGNGAGKSTLLKLLARITHPSEGRITLRGRVGSLLEVGTGFHPELSGRENIYLSGSVIGMRRAEIHRHFDAIVDFAEIASHLDTPVKHYSSGMYTRLAFAVAAHLDSDILLIDEILAVGDARFQQRCLGKMDAIRQEGRTLVFVSHNMQSIRQLCPNAIWLDHGAVVERGPSEQVIASYLAKTTSADATAGMAQRIAALPPDPCIRLLDVRVTQDGDATAMVTGLETRISIDYTVLRETDGLRLYFLLCDAEGQILFRSFAHGDAPDLPAPKPGCYTAQAVIPADFLAPIRYRIMVGASIYNVRKCFPQELDIPIQVMDHGRLKHAYAHAGPIGVKLAPLIAWQTRPTLAG